MAPPDPPLSLDGTVLSHYRLIAKLGEGGFGSVYRAQDLHMPRHVAIKVLSDTRGSDASSRKRFLDEAIAASRLDNPHVCVLHEFDEADGRPFIVMQLVEGEDLKRRIARGPLEPSRVCEIVAAIGSALSAAHALGILHRDVKSANILLGEDGSIKLADFGLARLAESSIRTTTGTVMGTPHYIAPELLQGSMASRASDQYGLAVVAYECLVGRPPFLGEGPALGYAIVNVDPEPPSRRRQDISPKWDEVIARGLAKAPSRRYPTVNDLVQAVAGCHSSHGDTIEARSTPGPPPSVAVMFFENLSNDPDSDYFCAGITEDILTDLSKVPDLRVASRDAVLRYRNQNSDAMRIGTELGVRAVVQGRVRRAGNRVRITTQLVDSTTGYQLWAERYDRTLEDVFAVQEDIARAIASALGRALTPTESAEIGRARPAVVEAYDLYLRGRDFYRRYTRDDNLRALDSFEQAVRLDPSYALAWAGIADCCGQMIDKGWDADRAWQARGFDAARRSIEHDSRLAEGHKAEALLWTTRRDSSRAIQALERALDVDPRYIPALINLAQEYLGGGDLAGAERALRRGITADPHSAYSHLLLATVLLYTCRYGAAIDASRRADQEGGSSFFTDYAAAIRIHAHAEESDFEAAARALTEARASGTSDRMFAACEALVDARAGRAVSARRLLSQLQSAPPEQSYGCELAAFAAAVIGDPAQTVAFLRAAEAVDPRHPSYWRVNPELRMIRGQTAFEEHLGDRGRRIIWPIEAPGLSTDDRGQFAVYSEASGLPES